MRTKNENKTILSKEKKEEYKENRAVLAKANREKRKQEVNDGTTQNRHLAFLRDLIDASGYNMSTLAKQMETTQQSLHWIFNVRDDCKISRAEEILAALGLTLKVKIKRNPLKPEVQKLSGRKYIAHGVENSIVGDFPTRGSQVKVPEYVQNCPENARLRFLADYFIEMGIGVKQFENMLGYSNSFLLAAITRDDLLISQVFTIAEKTGGSIVWEVTAA